MNKDFKEIRKEAIRIASNLLVSKSDEISDEERVAANNLLKIALTPPEQLPLTPDDVDPDDVDQATIDSWYTNEFPKNMCAMCEEEFEENLKWTDGVGYFCEECGPTILDAFQTFNKGD